MSRPAPDPAALFARLPAETQDQLRAIAREARDPVGDPRDRQTIFDRHIDFLDALTMAGLRHGRLAAVLAAVGVHRGDGTPLPRGTVSSALCRARLHAAAAHSGSGGAAEGTVPPLHTAADSGSLLQPPAEDGKVLPRPAVDDGLPQQTAALSSTPPPSSGRKPRRPRQAHRGEKAAAPAQERTSHAVRHLRDRRQAAARGHPSQPAQE